MALPMAPFSFQMIQRSLVLAFLVGVFLGAADTFGAGFLLLALLALVTGAFLGASVISVGVGLGGGAGWALATRPRSTWFQPSPRLSCSADGWG